MLFMLSLLLGIGIFALKASWQSGIWLKFKKDPLAIGLISLLLFGLTIVGPIVLAYYLKNINLTSDRIIIHNPLRFKKIELDYKELKSYSIHGKRAEGMKFNEVTLKLYNGKRIRITSKSNANTKELVKELARKKKH